MPRVLPSQVLPDVVTLGMSTERNVLELAAGAERHSAPWGNLVAPGSHKNTCGLPCRFRLRVRLPALKHRQRFAHKRIEPSGRKVSRRVHLAIAMPQRVARPLLFLAVMLDNATE